MKIDVDIRGVGICAPGLADWNCLLDAFTGTELNVNQPLEMGSLLSIRDRRRAPVTVKLTFSAAQQACDMAGITPDKPIAIFSTAMGDMDISDYMCRILAHSPDQLSPTRFHNSVHNAASGYWSIGVGAKGDVTALCGGPDSATVGLIEALSRISDTEQPVLLVIYDGIATGPMHDLFPTVYPFCAAFLLSRPVAAPPLARLSAEPGRGPDSVPPMPASLIERIADNPAARVLPLLALIGGQTNRPVMLGAEQGPGILFRRREA
ncbi:MAG: beta-ketoacyl synthase chain length factor [Wenzhouxiangellaceae bacterium]|nr:beta-ketoacyl synthase chain length factor [Wenzhouxiangellaceae bacterium]